MKEACRIKFLTISFDPIIFPSRVKRLPVDWYGNVNSPINTKIMGYAIPAIKIIKRQCLATAAYFE